MTLLDRPTNLHTPESATGVDVFDVYDAPNGDQQVVVIGPSDFRAPAAFKIEKDNMILMGDTPENAEADLLHGYENARYLTLYPKNEAAGTQNMLGVVRITDAHPITKRLITVEQITELTHEDYDEVFEHIVIQTGQSDPSKIFDINMYGLSGDVITAGFGDSQEGKQLFRDAKHNLMYAMCREGVRAHQENGATTALAFFNESSIKAFTSRGYDWKALNGYKPMVEVRPDASGTMQEGLTLLPTVLDIAQHIERMSTGATEHLGQIATFMFAKGIALPRPVSSL